MRSGTSVFQVIQVSSLVSNQRMSTLRATLTLQPRVLKTLSPVVATLKTLRDSKLQPVKHTIKRGTSESCRAQNMIIEEIT